MAVKDWKVTCHIGKNPPSQSQPPPEHSTDRTARPRKPQRRHLEKSAEQNLCLIRRNGELMVRRDKTLPIVHVAHNTTRKRGIDLFSVPQVNRRMRKRLKKLHQ